MIYFDNSATTPIYPQALDTYVKTSQQIIGNPSGLHGLGSQVNRLLQQARKQTAELINVSANEIYFTSGGTKGGSWVLKGTVIEKREFDNHIIISAVEHPAVTETAGQLVELGFKLPYTPVDKEGRVKVEELQKLIRKETILVSVMAVNSEVGTIQPIREINEVLAEFLKIHFHVDAVQAIRRVNYSEQLTDRVDFTTLSAHKFHGPRGIGFMYWKQGKRLVSLLTGGGQEDNQRSGTGNVSTIVAMAKALRLHLKNEQQRPQHVATLRSYLLKALEESQSVTVFSQDNGHFAPYILCFALKGIRDEVLVHALEEKQIYISTTSACSSRKKMASSILYTMHVLGELATSTVRISLDEGNTMAEIKQFMIVFNQLYQEFSRVN